MRRVIVVVTLAFATGCAQPMTGVLVMAHGGDPGWNREVEAIVAPLRQKMPAETAFGMATPSTMEQAVQRLESQGVRRIAVVRMFISGESFLEPTEYILGLRDTLPADPKMAIASVDAGHACHTPPSNAPTGNVLAASSLRPVAVDSGEAAHDHHHMEPPRRIPVSARIVLSREGVADSSLVDQILIDRVRALSRDPATESVLILGHGPGDDGENDRWLAKMRQRAAGISRLGPFRRIHCETLREDWPEKRTAAEKRIRQIVEDGNRDCGRVIVVPFRVAGFGPYKAVLDGLSYVADGRGFCPHPQMTRWVKETVERTLVAR